VCEALSILAVYPALATALPNATDQARLDGTVRYLQEIQNPDGGFGGEPGGESDSDFSAWVALALAAAGINPQDQAKPGGADAYTYLAEHAGELKLTTDFERALLVADASGASPEDFGGVHLVQQILARQLTGIDEGAFVHEAGERSPSVNDTIFAILALSPIHEAGAQAALARAAAWLEEQQNAEGGWPSMTVCRTHTTPRSGCENDVDMTGAAIEALNAADRPNTVAQQKAFGFLHEAQHPDGGFSEHLGEGESNVASTAWAVQGMWAAGQSPETWLQGSGAEPLSYMQSMQQTDGSIRWKASNDSNPVWMTAYVAPAFAGRALPIAVVPRAIQSKPTSPDSGSTTPAAQGTAEAGHGGESSQPGSGVIAGGGGTGAPLFSRPQPQSRGATAGGARSLSGARKRSATKHRRSPSRPRKAPVSATMVRTTTARTTTTPIPEPGISHSGMGGGGEAGGREVKGVLIGEPTSTRGRDALEPGAPGLRGAEAGGNQTPWLAIGIGGLVALLVLAGTQLERRRPQAIL
jgi:prenyltransferase beta subunit